MKKIISVFLIGLMILSNFTFITFAEDEITVMVNGEKLISDVPAQSIKVTDESGNYVGDRTMLPIRAISEKLNCDVYWNAETKGITIYRKDNLYLMWLGMDTAFHLDGLSISKGYKMDVPPTIINDRTLVPVRAVAELLGAEVNWIGETKTVDIKYEIGELEKNEGVAESCDVYETYFYEEYYDIYNAYLNGTSKKITGKIILENDKEMEFELYPEIAPLSALNFRELAKADFYDNTIFHRVIKDFVAQGGGFDKDKKEKTSAPVQGEFLLNGIFNLIPHERGMLSMARANDYNSASNQFFICHKDAPHLNGYYAAFGKITKGLEVLDEICDAKTDEYDVPLENIVIRKIIINE